MRRRIQIIAALLLCTLCIGSCTRNIVDIDPPTGSSSATYGWNTSSSVPLVYIDSNIISRNSSTVNLSFFPSGNTGNEFTVNQTSNNQTEYFSLFSGSDSQIVSGITFSSVIPVPDQYRFFHADTATVTQAPIITHVASIGSLGYCATDGTNIYYKHQNASWEKSDIKVVSQGEEISKLSSNGSDVFAATSRGSILISSDAGISFTVTQPIAQGGSIAALSSVPGGATYAVAQSNSLSSIWKFNGSNSVQLVKALSISDVSDISAISIDSFPFSKVTFLLIGSKTSGLYFAKSIDNFSSLKRFRDSNDSVMFENEPIRFISLGPSEQNVLIQGSRSLYLATPELPAKDTSGFYLFTWKPFKNNYEQALAATENTFIGRVGTTSVETFSIATGKSAPLAKLINRSILEITVRGNSVLAVTDSGVYALATINGTTANWELQVLPVTHTTSIIQIADKLRLLISGASGLSIGATWQAGTAYVATTNTPLQITATVADHFDSIRLSKDISYEDIYKIEYTLKDAINAGQLDQTTWTIYFAKNQGPILIDLSSGGTLRRRIFRIK